MGLVDQDGRPPSRRFVLIGRPKLWWNANFWDRRATLSSLRGRRTSETVVKCEFCTSPRNPLVTSWSSDVQNWGEMRILYVVVATLSSFRAHRTSKTEVKCESAWVVGQPSRRFVLIGRLKLRWNANLWLRSWTLSSLRAGQMSETVVKCWFLYAAGCPGRRALDSYILVHAAVVKRTFWKCGWHAVVARRTFCFCWMNPLVGFGGSMARNCGETQIFFWNCRRLRAKRSFWKLCSMKIWGRFARNARFGSLFCEIWRKSRAKRSFLKLVLWKFEEASHETLVLEACSLKFRGNLARNARFGSLFCEICRKSRAKRSFLKLVLWKFDEASHETLVFEACSLKFRGSLARNVRFGSLFCEIWRKPRTKRSFWKLCLRNFEEASHETFVLEACSVKFWGSLARNARFGSLFCEITMKPRTKRSFWKLCVFSVFSFCVFSLCVFSLCVFSLCVFSLCVFSLSVCFLSVFSICVFFVCVFSLCVFSLSVFSLCVFSVCVFYLRVFCLCVFSLCVFSLCVFSLCVFCLCFLSAFFFCLCVFSLCVFSLCVFSLCVFCLCFLSACCLCVLNYEICFWWPMTNPWPQQMIRQ